MQFTMRARRTGKLLAFAAILCGLPLASHAQVANISTTGVSSFNTSGFNLTTGMVSAISNTYFSNDGDTGLLIKGGGSAVTATIVTQATQMSQAGYGTTALSNLIVSIPASSYVYIGPFPQGRWNTVYGTVQVSLTSVTGVSLTALSQSQ